MRRRRRPASIPTEEADLDFLAEARRWLTTPEQRQQLQDVVSLLGVAIRRLEDFPDRRGLRRKLMALFAEARNEQQILAVIQELVNDTPARDAKSLPKAPEQSDQAAQS